DPVALLQLFAERLGRAQPEVVGHPRPGPQLHQRGVLGVEVESAAAGIGGAGDEVPGFVDGEAVQAGADRRAGDRQQGEQRNQRDPCPAPAGGRHFRSYAGRQADRPAARRPGAGGPYNPGMHEPNNDVLVIGGGHNGLVCAAYLAAAGLKVRVLERRGVVGGAAVTEEFHPGFRNSLASYTVSLLNPRVIRDLRLVEHGLRIVERPYANFLPLPDGRAFRFGGEHTQAEVAKWSLRDAERLPAYFAMLERVVAVLRELMLRTPPNVSDRF